MKDLLSQNWQEFSPASRWLLQKSTALAARESNENYHTLSTEQQHSLPSIISPQNVNHTVAKIKFHHYQIYSITDKTRRNTLKLSYFERISDLLYHFETLALCKTKRSRIKNRKQTRSHTKKYTGKDLNKWWVKDITE